MDQNDNHGVQDSRSGDNGASRGKPDSEKNFLKEPEEALTAIQRQLRGDDLFSKNMDYLAVWEYAEALKLDSSLIDARYMLGRCYENGIGNLMQAIKAYEEVLRQAPDHIEARKHLNACLACVKTPHDLDGHDRMWESLLQSIPSIFEEDANQQPVPPIQEETPERKKRRLKTFIEISIDSAITGSGDAEGDRILLTKGLAHCDELLAMDPNSEFALANKANALGMLGRKDEAIRIYDAILKTNPENAEVWHNRAVLLAHMGDVTGALASWNRALEADPNLAIAWADKASCLWMTVQTVSDLDVVLEGYNRAVINDPKLASAWLNKGRLLISLRQPAEAAVALRRGLELLPKAKEAHSDLGNAYLMLNRLQDAANCFQRVLDIDPSHIPSMSNLAIALCELGRIEEGIGYFDRVLQIQPENEAVRQMRTQAVGMLKERSNKPSGKRDYLKEIEAAQYNGRTSDALLIAEEWVAAEPACCEAHYRQALCLGEMKLYPEAEEAYARALKLDSSVDDVWYDRGANLLRMGESAKAHECFEKAITINPNASDAWSMDGAALSCRGRMSAAIGRYQHALELDPNNEPARLNLAALLPHLKGEQSSAT